MVRRAARRGGAEDRPEAGWRREAAGHDVQGAEGGETRVPPRCGLAAIPPGYRPIGIGKGESGACGDRAPGVRLFGYLSRSPLQEFRGAAAVTIGRERAP